MEFCYSGQITFLYRVEKKLTNGKGTSEKRKQRQVYLTFLSVASGEDADLLKKASVWEVLNEVRKAWPGAITTEKIADNLLESQSTVYGALKPLKRAGFIGSTKIRKWKKWGRPSRSIKQKPDWKRTGKSPWVYFEPCEKHTVRERGKKENPWGDIIFSKKFETHIGRIIKNADKLNQLTCNFVDLINSLYEVLLENKTEEVHQMLPDLSKKCKRCGKSHELHEFIKALSLFTTALILESDEMTELITKLQNETG